MKLPGQMTREVLRHVAKTPATVAYPAKPAQIPPKFRGKMVFHAEKCSGCQLCVKDCPSHAIAIEKVGDKRFRAVFDLDHCIYCSQCAYSCNRGAIETTPEFELASLSRTTLRLVFHAPETVSPAPVKTSNADAPKVEQDRSDDKPKDGTP